MGKILLIILAVLIILSMISQTIENVKFALSSQVRSTILRQPFSGNLKKTEWYQNDLKWMIKEQTMYEGLALFYQKTGLQPVVLLLPYKSDFWNEDGFANVKAMDTYLESVYERTFSDDAHILFAYFATQSDYSTRWNGQFRYVMGKSAATIMDNEAQKIFSAYLGKYSSKSNTNLGEVIGKAFKSTGKRIMGMPMDTGTVVTIVGVILIAISGTVYVKIVVGRRKQKAAYNKRILEIPLEELGTEAVVAELEESYGDEDDAEIDELLEIPLETFGEYIDTTELEKKYADKK